MREREIGFVFKRDPSTKEKESVSPNSTASIIKRQGGEYTKKKNLKDIKKTCRPKKGTYQVSTVRALFLRTTTHS